MTDPHLKPFLSRGGTLLLYHGWNDQLVAPLNSVNYYNRIVSTVGAQTASASVRLFMMPGMDHCAGGEGPNTFDRMRVIEDWVEKGQVTTKARSHQGIEFFVFSWFRGCIWKFANANRPRYAF